MRLGSRITSTTKAKEDIMTSYKYASQLAVKDPVRSRRLRAKLDRLALTRMG